MADLAFARIVAFAVVCGFVACVLKLGPRIPQAKKEKVIRNPSFPLVFLLLVALSAAAMLYVLRAHPWVVGPLIAVVLGLGTAASLSGVDRRLSIVVGAAVTGLFIVANLSVSLTSVAFRDAATFVSTLSIGVYFSRLIGFRALATASILLSAYDFVAVYVTKHMAELNEAGRNVLPLVAVPYVKDGLLVLPGTGLGSGDFVILAALIAGAQTQYGERAARFTAIGAIIGFASTYLLMGALGVWLAPGLPGITAGALIGLWMGRRGE